MSKKPQTSEITLFEVRVRNFRSLRSIDVQLDKNLTLLIGENNTGKTSFLEALFAAIGMGRRAITTEDVFLSPSEKMVPKDRAVTIDLLLRPTDSEGNIAEFFPTGSFWLELWGNGISQDERDNDFVAIRTRMEWDRNKGEYATRRNFLKNWPDDLDRAEINEMAGLVSSNQIEPIALYLLDAKRDVYDEFRNRSSFWHKLISEPGLTDDQIEDLERSLTQLNEEIVSSSDVFTHIQTHLEDLYHAVNSDPGSVTITPLARQIRDLSTGMNVNFATTGAQNFPLVRHGMGTRSLAAVLIFRAYTTWRQERVGGDAVHPMLALEEPEAHLHPQSQRALFDLVSEIPGQRIISSHSPYIASQARIEQFRCFRKDGAKTVVRKMDTASLVEEDIHKIDRKVMTTRGEMLYARAIVLFEGVETEEQSLPVFAEKYWGEHIHSLGISMIGVGGVGNYGPFLGLASNFGIPWYVFSDGEREALATLESALEKIGSSLKSPNVFIIPNGKKFEEHIASEEYKDALVEMIIALKAENDHHKEALRREWEEENDVLTRIESYLSSNKSMVARHIAEVITSVEQEELRFPSPIRDLLEKISEDLGLDKRSSR